MGLRGGGPVSPSLGNDGQIYLLLARQGAWEGPRFLPAPDCAYSALALMSDWLEGTLVHCQRLDFGCPGLAPDFLQPLGKHYLLVDACDQHLPGGGWEQNAAIIDGQGRIQRRFSLGDDVQCCLVDGRNEILAGYGDLGVLGTGGDAPARRDSSAGAAPENVSGRTAASRSSIVTPCIWMPGIGLGFIPIWVFRWCG